MKIKKLKKEMQDVLENNILPYWINKLQDNEQGGFYGRVTGEEVVMPNADKGAILNARILWTFAAAYRILKKDEYLEMATRAKRYLIDYFYDSEFGGVYWSLYANGEPKDTKKQIYALGFAIYSLSEYHRATRDKEALDYAIRLFESIEKYSFDAVNNGYCEALTREWSQIADMRLSEKDENERKTMNTHLHILEPYANLYRVWKDQRLKKQLRNLVELFMDKIIDNETGHLGLFFDDDWCSKCRIVSYGHDIEASWLLHEAALELGDKAILKKMEPLVEYVAAAADEGILPNGSMIYETFLDKNKTVEDIHWWVQAENVVGHINLYQHFGDEVSLQKALRAWEFIKANLIDYKHGEWHLLVNKDGIVDHKEDKAGFWKCPYHNGRMCMEIIERVF